jgi:hypothetical protein
MFAMRGSSPLTVGTAGQVHLRLGAKQLGKFGSIKLTFTPHGKGQTSDCNGHDYTVTYTGALTGKVQFDTGTGRHGWGVAMATAGKLGFKRHITLIEGYGNGVPTCIPQQANPRACPVTVAWQNAAGGSTYFIGGDEQLGARTIGYMTAARVAPLTSPKRAMRIDTVTRRTPVPTLTPGATTTLHITTDGHRASGTADISTTDTPTTGTDTCGPNGTTVAENQWNGTFANGSQPLSVHADLYKPIDATDDTTPASTFQRVTP